MVILLIVLRWKGLDQFAILMEIVMEDVQRQTTCVEIIYAHLKMKHRLTRVRLANLITNVKLERLAVQRFAFRLDFKGKLALEEHA